VKLKTLKQGTIFDEMGENAQRKRIGYKSDVVCQVTNITYRQLDYWTRTGLIKPSVNQAYGSGNKRLFDFSDIVLVKTIKSLLDSGIALQKVKRAVNFLRDNQLDITKIILICDQDNIYVSTNAQDFIDVLAGGQGVFGLHIQKLCDVLKRDLNQISTRKISQKHLNRGNPDSVKSDLKEYKPLLRKVT
jgi:DNA-binding transcriptional MerR regulator